MSGASIVSPGAPSPYIISREEYNALIERTRGGGFEGTRDRVTEFFRADKTQEALLQTAKLGGMITITTTASGAIIGGCCAGAPGALTGGLIGLGIGVGFTAIVGTISLHDNYRDWRASVEHDFIIKKFKQIHRDHPILQKYIDPVTYDVMKEPLITPCGHTFERKSIHAWIDQKTRDGRTPKCPTCRSAIKKDELYVDISLIARVKKVYALYALAEQNNPNCPKELRDGFVALNKDLEIQVREVLKQISTELTLLLNKEKITPRAFSLKMREVTEMFIEDEVA